jgi:hypothetical protein
MASLPGLTRTHVHFAFCSGFPRLAKHRQRASAPAPRVRPQIRAAPYLARRGLHGRAHAFRRPHGPRNCKIFQYGRSGPDRDHGRVGGDGTHQGQRTPALSLKFSGDGCPAAAPEPAWESAGASARPAARHCHCRPACEAVAPAENRIPDSLRGMSGRCRPRAAWTAGRRRASVAPDRRRQIADLATRLIPHLVERIELIHFGTALHRRRLAGGRLHAESRVIGLERHGRLLMGAGAQHTLSRFLLAIDEAMLRHMGAGFKIARRLRSMTIRRVRRRRWRRH